MSPQPPKGYILLPEEKKDFVEPPKGYVLEPYKDPITAISEKVAPFVGRAAVEALPALGSIFGVPGILAGTATKTALKVARPDLVGEPPQGVAGGTADILKELLLNKVLPSGLSKLGGLALKTDMQGLGPTTALSLKNFPAVRDAAVKRMTETLSGRIYPETGVIEQGAQNTANKFGEMQDNISQLREAHPDIPPSKSIEFIDGKPQIVENPGGPHPLVQNAMDALADTFGRNRVGGMLIRMQKEAQNFGGDIARTQTYKEIANTTLSDVIHVQNAKLTAGPEFTNDLAVNRLLVNTGNPSEGTIDAAKALNELGGKNSEIYKEAMNPASYESMKKMLEKMAELEKTNTTDMVLGFSGRRLMWNAMGGAGLGMGLGHPGLGAVVGAAKAEAPVLTNMVLRKIMKNPETVQIVTQALTTPMKSPQAHTLNMVLTEILPRLIQGEADLAATPGR